MEQHNSGGSHNASGNRNGTEKNNWMLKRLHRSISFMARETYIISSFVKRFLKKAGAVPFPDFNVQAV